MTTFYLGIHETYWANRLTIPVMMSRRRLARERPHTCTAPWVLDSGGFTELTQHGRWTVTAAQYADEIARWAEQLPGMRWAAPQDWMCEPAILDRTGLTVAHHQANTIANYLDLTALELPVIPVLQGQTIDDYLDHVDQYHAAGVNLTTLDTVGLGSVCRRENTAEIVEIVTPLAGAGIRLHGFGCKAGALRRVGRLLASADSMAWSRGGRQRGTCEHLASRCANHLHWALDWRAQVVAALDT